MQQQRSGTLRVFRSEQFCHICLVNFKHFNVAAPFAIFFTDCNDIQNVVKTIGGSTICANNNYAMNIASSNMLLSPMNLAMFGKFHSNYGFAYFRH